MANLAKRTPAGSRSGGAGGFHSPQAPGRVNYFGVASDRGPAAARTHRHLGIAPITREPEQVLPALQEQRESRRGVQRVLEALKLKKRAA